MRGYASGVWPRIAGSGIGWLALGIVWLAPGIAHPANSNGNSNDNGKSFHREGREGPPR
jgi:hypothetical protein